MLDPLFNKSTGLYYANLLKRNSSETGCLFLNLAKSSRTTLLQNAFEQLYQSL